ncbi:hypothetical protein sS8_1490 [Methylocaldum marinum]|uniref:Uncharacterized protein n=1 Tax=Methylocaldum marinum TaxID=1432792 RepID=A0A250KP43_9GAMM|nr:hypothetical protein sS8_1490 [Methylocaldum marinum]
MCGEQREHEPVPNRVEVVPVAKERGVYSESTMGVRSDSGSSLGEFQSRIN